MCQLWLKKRNKPLRFQGLKDSKKKKIDEKKIDNKKTDNKKTDKEEIVWILTDETLCRLQWHWG